MEKFEIKIVKLKSGEELICFCYISYKDNKIYLKYPKIFYFGYDSDLGSEELIISDWLTPVAYAYQEVGIDLSQVLFTTFANTGFGVEYLQSVQDYLDPESDLYKSIGESIESLNIEDEIPVNSTLH